MLSWQELSQQLQQIVKTFVRFVKSRRREEALIGLAALLFLAGYSFPGLLPTDTQFKNWVASWHGLLIIPAIFYVAGAVFLFYGGYRIWQMVLTPELPPPKDRPSAIKGPVAFAPADGELFRRLGREDELGKLLGFIEDDQVRLVVLMGASGAGKTSLLRAGLTDILKNKGIDYHYWEAVPTSPGQRLLHAIQESWSSAQARGYGGAFETASGPRPETLEDLVNSSPALGGRSHVVVLDQFEQLHGSGANNQVLRLLRKVARESKPPHRVTWLVAFRREFRAEWEDFTLPEKERGIYPSEISLRLFTPEKARDVISQLIDEAKLSIQQKVVDNLVEAATVEGEVSPVDIGIGLLALAELHDRQGGQTITLDDYQFAGGAEGLLTQYIGRCLDTFPEADRQTILDAMLALREPENYRRIAEGKTCAELAEETKADPVRLKTRLERLTRRDMRLLEAVAPTDESDTHYRLPHERLIPALHRMAGQLLGEVTQTKLSFENAFTAWKNSGQRARYLLKAGELRAVERYESQIPWGKDAPEKRAYLRRSIRRRTLSRLSLTAIFLCLTVTAWLTYSKYQRYGAQQYLRDNNYPPELYDWQNQLKALALRDPVSVQRFPWLRSNTLEELTITSRTGSLDGLVDSLAGCRELKKFTFNGETEFIQQGELRDLTPLSRLTNLTHLTLHIHASAVSDLTPLEKLSALTHLDLEMGSSGVSDLTPLAKLTNLTQLTLNYNGYIVLEPLTKLTNLTQLTLDISEGSNLTPLEKMPALTHLTLDMNNVDDFNLSPLEKMPALTHLTLNISDGKNRFTVAREGEVSDSVPLALLSKLTNLTHLTLDIDHNGVSDLTPLLKLTNLTHLTLKNPGNGARALPLLEKLPALAHLDLDIISSDVNDLTPLTRMPALTQLTLNLSSREMSDLTPLTKIPALTQLDLRTNIDQLSNLMPLGKLPAFTQLTLHNESRAEVSDLTPLSKLTNLTHLTLDISDSKVSDLTPLEKLPALTHLALDIRRRDISDLTPLTRMPALTHLTLDLGDSKVSDLTPISKLNFCQTLVLRASASQRMLLRMIPQGVTSLEFARSDLSLIR